MGKIVDLNIHFFSKHLIRKLIWSNLNINYYTVNIEETFEDKSIDTTEKRLKVYGRKDHIRLYGLDYLWRFELKRGCITY